MPKAARTPTTPRRANRRKPAPHAGFSGIVIPGLTDEAAWMNRAAEDLATMRAAAMVLRDDDEALCRRLADASPELAAAMVDLLHAAQQAQQLHKARAELHGAVVARLLIAMQRAGALPKPAAVLNAAFAAATGRPI